MVFPALINSIFDSIEMFLFRIFNKLFRRGVYMPEAHLINLFKDNQIETNIHRISRKREKKVAFLCISVAMWKYEVIFNRLLKEDGYAPIVVIAPSRRIPAGQRRKDYNEIIDYCRKKKFPYLPLRSRLFNIGQNVKKQQFDLVFFSQPYNGITCKEYDYGNFKDSLLCYIPYDDGILTSEFSYNSILHKIAWKLFYPYGVQKIIAESYGQKRNNIIITGPCCYDIYRSTYKKSWGTPKKKIIWAPHHSILADDWLHFSCFLEVCDYMFELAELYKEDVFIAFKPHPMLMPQLRRLWGKKKTELYYEKWNTLENGMYSNSASFPLFKDSDALIHDCSSFTLDYMMTGKPCLYLLLRGDNNQNFIPPAKDAFNAHYHALKKDDIASFIKKVIIEGDDYMKKDRDNVFNKWFINNEEYIATETIVETLKSV